MQKYLKTNQLHLLYEIFCWHATFRELLMMEKSGKYNVRKMMSVMIAAWNEWAWSGDDINLRDSINTVSPTIERFKMPIINSEMLMDNSYDLKVTQEEERILKEIEIKIKEEMDDEHGDEIWIDEQCEENEFRPEYEDQIQREFEQMIEYQELCKKSWFDDETYEKIHKDNETLCDQSIMNQLKLIQKSERFSYLGEENLDPEDIIKQEHYFISTERRIKRALLRRKKRRFKEKEKLKYINQKIANGEFTDENEKEFWFKFRKKGRKKSKIQEDEKEEKSAHVNVNIKSKKPPDKPSNKKMKLLVSKLYQTATSTISKPKRRHMLCGDEVINTEVFSRLVKCRDVISYLVPLLFLFESSTQSALEVEQSCERRLDIDENENALEEQQR
jgi:hypothetical protein